MPVQPKSDFDFRESRLRNEVPRIRCQFRTDGPRDRPAGPSPPPSAVTPGFIHPIGVVLKMHPRISEKQLRGRPLENPGHGRIRQRMESQHRFIALEFSPQGTVEAKQRSRREPASPQGLRILQTGLIKLGPAIRVSKRMQRAPIHPCPRFRQPRTGRQFLQHARFVSRPTARVNPRDASASLTLALATPADSAKTAGPERHS